MTATFAEEPGYNHFLFLGELFWEETEYESRQTSKMKRQYCSLCLKLPDTAQSLVFSSQIVTQTIRCFYWLVSSKFQEIAIESCARLIPKKTFNKEV